MIFGVILGILFGAVTLGGVIFAIWAGINDEYDTKKPIIISICIAVVSLLLFITIPFSFHTVDTGEVAVVKYLGKARDVREPGTYFDFWMFNSYTKYDTKVQNVDINTSAYSSDAQTMNVQMTLQYSVQSEHIIDIMSEYGSLDILQNRIQSIAIEKTKSVLSSYKAMNIIADRAAMSPAVEIAIKEAIGSGYYVNVAAVVLTNIDFSDAFEQAVEDKMIAEQAKLKAEYENQTKVAQAEAEAAAKVATAEAEQAIKRAEKAAELEAATANKDIAEAEAAANKAKAEGDAEALRIQSVSVAKMLGVNVIVENGVEYVDHADPNAYRVAEYLEYLAYIAKWDGKLPVVNGSTGSVIIPGDIIG